MDCEEDIIDLQLCSDKILVWNAEDVKTIREKHNIVGKLIGCLPRSPQQNLQLGLPLQLMPEEAAVLIEYGVARIIKMKAMTPTAEDAKTFEKDRLNSFREQTHIYQLDKESRKMEILKNDKSSYGKKRKQLRKERARSRKMLLSKQIEKDVEMVILPTTTGGTTKVSSQRDTNTEHQLKDLKDDEGIAVNRTRFEEDEINKSLLHNSGERSKREIDNTENSEENVKRQKIVMEQDKNEIDKKLIKSEVSGNFEESNITKKNDSGLPILETMHSNIDDSNKIMHVENELKDRKTSNTFCLIEDEKNDAEISYEFEDQAAKGDVIQRNARSPSTVVKDIENERTIENDCDPEKVTEKEESSTRKKYQGCLIHLPTCATKFEKLPVEEWNYPSSDVDWLRFCVFKDFWEKGYHITSGGKFGGDFLVYPGNPMLFHSAYIAICLPYTESFSARELVQFGRMASNVRKTVIICSLDKDDKLVFTSVQWTGIS